MALWHAAHSILTSNIPWNTSSPASLLVVPGSQTRLDHPLHLFSHTSSLSFTRPPRGLSPGISGSHSQSVRASRWVNFSIRPLCRSSRIKSFLLFGLCRAGGQHPPGPLLTQQREDSIRLVHERHGGEREKASDDNKCAQLSGVSLLWFFWPQKDPVYYGGMLESYSLISFTAVLERCSWPPHPEYWWYFSERQSKVWPT